MNDSRFTTHDSRLTVHGSRLTEFFLLALVLLGTGACLSVPKPRSDGPPGYHDLVIRAKREVDGKMRGGRVMVKIQGRQGMILFLTPLSQVALKLEVTDGRAALFNPRSRSYWQGEVREMMRALWNLPLSWEELTELVLRGSLPSGSGELGDLKILRRDGNQWTEAEIDGPNDLWRFSVSRRTFCSQALPACQDRTGWVERTLEEVVHDEADR